MNTGGGSGTTENVLTKPDGEDATDFADAREVVDSMGLDATRLGALATSLSIFGSPFPAFLSEFFFPPFLGELAGAFPVPPVQTDYLITYC